MNAVPPIYLRAVGEFELHFNIKPTTLLGHLKNKYAERVAVPASLMCFQFKGRRIVNDDTAASLSMIHGDVIEVLTKIQLLLAGQGYEVHFVVEYGAPMRDLKAMYAGRTLVPESTVCLTYNGRRLADEDTPSSLGMKDADTVMVLQKIELQIVSPVRRRVRVSIKYGATMLSLKEAYAERVSVDVGTLTFAYNGRCVKDEDTPYTLKLDNHGTIDTV